MSQWKLQIFQIFSPFFQRNTVTFTTLVQLLLPEMPLQDWFGKCSRSLHQFLLWCCGAEFIKRMIQFLRFLFTFHNLWVFWEGKLKIAKWRIWRIGTAFFQERSHHIYLAYVPKPWFGLKFSFWVCSGKDSSITRTYLLCALLARTFLAAKVTVGWGYRRRTEIPRYVCSSTAAGCKYNFGILPLLIES